MCQAFGKLLGEYWQMKEIGVVAFCRVSRQVWLGMDSPRRVCRKVRVHLPAEGGGEFQAGNIFLGSGEQDQMATYHVCRAVAVETKRASLTWECLVHVETRHWPLAKHSSEHILLIEGKTHTPAQWRLLHLLNITALIPSTQRRSGCLTDQTCQQCVPWSPTSPKAQTFLPLPPFRFLHLPSLQIGWQVQKKFPEVDWWLNMGVWSLPCLLGARGGIKWRRGVYRLLFSLSLGWL